MESIVLFKCRVVEEGVTRVVEAGFPHSDLLTWEMSMRKKGGEHLCLKLIVDFKFGPFITHSNVFSSVWRNLVHIPFTYISPPLVMKELNWRGWAEPLIYHLSSLREAVVPSLTWFLPGLNRFLEETLLILYMLRCVVGGIFKDRVHVSRYVLF